MGTFRATLVAVFLAVVSALPPAAAQPVPNVLSADDEARREYEAGREAYDGGQFHQAIEHFSRAYQLSPRPQLLFNVARAADSDGQYTRAVVAYESYLERLPDAQNREFVQARLQKLRDPSHAQAAPTPTPVVVAAPVESPAPSLQAWESTPPLAADVPVRSSYPLVAAQRPLTATAGLLSIEGGIFTEHCLTVCPGVSNSLSIGALYGISDDFEIGAMPLQLGIAPEVSADNSLLFATYRFVRGEVDIGVRANFWLPVKDEFELDLWLPVLWRASPRIALLSGPRMAIVANPDTLTIVEIPVSVVLNATDSLWFKPQVGLNFLLSKPGPGDTLAMQLGAAVGYTFPAASGGPSVEPYVEVSFPWLVNAFDPDMPSSRYWRLYFGVSVYLDTRS